MPTPPYCDNRRHKLQRMFFLQCSTANAPVTTMCPLCIPNSLWWKTLFHTSTEVRTRTSYADPEFRSHTQTAGGCKVPKRNRIRQHTTDTDFTKSIRIPFSWSIINDVCHQELAVGVQNSVNAQFACPRRDSNSYCTHTPEGDQVSSGECYRLLYHETKLLGIHMEIVPVVGKYPCCTHMLSAFLFVWG